MCRWYIHLRSFHVRPIGTFVRDFGPHAFGGDVVAKNIGPGGVFRRFLTALHTRQVGSSQVCPAAILARCHNGVEHVAEDGTVSAGVGDLL